MNNEKINRSVSVNENNFSDMVGEFKSRYENIWWETETGFPDYVHSFSSERQREKERNLEHFITKLNLNIKSSVPETAEQRLVWLEGIKSSIFEYCRSSLDINEKYENGLFFESFTKVTEEFTRKAYEFDPKVNMNDIAQALRNVWTMNSIQVIFKDTVRFTPPIFAYSMLYPYTDNYLDNPHISLSSKKELNTRLHNRLRGDSVMSSDYNEQKIFELIGMIEEHYTRAGYSAVYESLYAIHSAQVRSLLLQGKKTAPYETDIMGISFEKGGTSVLADGYLTLGELGGEAAFFLFGYGVLLQLIDDLRDTAADSKNGHMTLFSQLTGKWPLDKLTNRLLNFSAKVLSAGEQFCEDGFLEMIKKNYAFLIMQAIAQNREFYDGDYLKKIETHSPLSFTYLRKLKPKLRKKFKKLNDIGAGVPADTLLRAGIALSK